MKFTFAETFCDPRQFAALAPAAENAGFDCFAVPESVVYPKHSDARYPYTASGDRSFVNQPMIDPFVLATHMAALTEKIRFLTFVVKLAVRNPILAAKSAASVAVISDNRFLFGVGLSPWPHDFALCGQPFEQRGKRMNEMIEIVRGLCGGGWFEYHGEFYDFGEISINPAPTQPMPILLGGHSDAALRRAALHGDGWVHAGGDKDQLQPLLARLQEIRKAEGVHGKPFEIHVISMDAFGLDGIRRLEDQGVTGVIVGFRNPYDPSTADMPVEDKVAAMNYYAETVISKL